ncbi:ChbG/HpnK family deacetylase, partial [bacterium]|nr:ChbG/HpnK family deacetylase [bacterium]
MKKIILTADDFGISKEANSAIENAFLDGILTSTCIMTNMPEYENAKVILRKLQNIDVSMHLNIIEGKPVLAQENNPLTDKCGNFNNSFIGMLIKSFDKKYLEYVEKEFEAQIVKLLNDGIIPVSINSNVHTHSIPKFFEIVSRLAQKYGIKYVRTQKENFYFVPNLKRHLNLSYFVNIIKNIILNTFTFINKNTLKKYKCNTNENFLGVLYTLNMD